MRCSAWLAKVEVPAPYLEYLAYYFESVRVRRALRMPVCRSYDGTFGRRHVAQLVQRATRAGRAGRAQARARDTVEMS